MAIKEAISPFTSQVNLGLDFGKFGIILAIFVVIAIIGGIIWILMKAKEAKKQWTHQLKVRRVLPNGTISEPFYHKMKRFPLIKGAEVFELEKPLLGTYLIPELDCYTGNNEYSILIDTNNRIYSVTGETFNPDKKSINVSAKHGEIDIGRASLKAKWQDMNKTPKRLEWSQIIKSALMFSAIVAVIIIAIVGIKEWGETQNAKVEAAQAEATAMEHLAEAVQNMEATVNTQKIIIQMLKQLYDTNNLQPIITGGTTFNETVL